MMENETREKTPLNVEVWSRKSIQKGSKSFAMASRLLPKGVRRDVHQLYSWFRHCDDCIDESSDPRSELDILKRQTREALNQSYDGQEAAFLALQDLMSRQTIPAFYFDEFLEGMEDDVHHTPIRNEAELRLYCYRVAGIVGLMMSHVLGVSDRRAMKNACDMGTAMQMTNIARDVADDFQRGRIYLPADWLAAEGISVSNLMDDKDKVARVVERLLDEADSYYFSGDQGLKFLHWRVDLAVRTARYVYSDIGRLVRNARAQAWHKRLFVGFWRKVYCALYSGAELLLTRRNFRWRPVAIDFVWKP